MNQSHIKNEILQYLKKITPVLLKSRLIENNGMLLLGLRLDYYPEDAEEISVLFNQYDNNLSEDKNRYDSSISLIKKNIKKIILEYGKQKTDLLIKSFDLDDIYKHQYEDKNIMYKVPHIYKRTHQNREIRKSLSFHYFDEIKLSLPNTYYFWYLLLKPKFMHEKVEAMFDMTNSIIERIKQLSFSYDLIKNIINEAQHLGNPDTFFIFYYHFTYFISLAKAIGDNLAWMINLYYKLNMIHFNIDLLDEKFKNILSNHKHTFNSIYSHHYFDDYQKLNEFRDIIQHRHIIGAMKVFIIENRQNHIFIPTNPEFLIDENLRTNKSNEFKKIITENVNSALFYGMHDYYITSIKEIENKFEDPLRFCQKHNEGLFSLIDNVYSRLVIELTRQKIGEVSHFYPKKSVAVIDLTDSLSIRDNILIEGIITSFQQEVNSMEIDFKKIEKSHKGFVGIKVIEKVRCNDIVYTFKKIDKNSFQKYI
jgi:hypothetical protein